MVSDATIHIPSFIKIGSAIQKLIGGKHRYIQTAWRLQKQSFIFLKKKGNVNSIFSHSFSVSKSKPV
jgi:hypothetical protein